MRDIRNTLKNVTPNMEDNVNDDDHQNEYKDVQPDEGILAASLIGLSKEQVKVKEEIIKDYNRIKSKYISPTEMWILA